MLYVTLSVRQMDIIPAAKTAADKSKPTLNKNSSRIPDVVEEQQSRQTIQSGSFREWVGRRGMLESSFIKPSKFIPLTF